MLWHEAEVRITQLECMHVSQSAPWDATLFRRGAPYKPLLMLAVMDGIRGGSLSATCIILNPWLRERYRHYLALCGDSVRDEPRMPFVHLRYEPFWELIPQPPYEGIEDRWDLRSESAFTQYVAGATIDHVLQAMMHQQRWYWILRHTLIRTYFGDSIAPHIWEI